MAKRNTLRLQTETAGVDAYAQQSASLKKSFDFEPTDRSARISAKLLAKKSVFQIIERFHRL